MDNRHSTLNAAEFVASVLLQNKLDKGGAPLIHHSLRVANMVANKSFNADLTIPAILHDTIEECDKAGCTPDARYIIKTLFGQTVFEMVNALTRDSSTATPETYRHYIERISNTEVAIIKLADLEDNLDVNRPSTKDLPDSLIRRYTEARLYLLFGRWIER